MGNILVLPVCNESLCSQSEPGYSQSDVHSWTDVGLHGKHTGHPPHFSGMKALLVLNNVQLGLRSKKANVLGPSRPRFQGPLQ